MRITLSVPLLAVGLIVVLLALNYYVPGILGGMEWLARTILGVMAVAGGIYVIYRGAVSGTKIDDVLSLAFGAVLIGLGAYMGFGINIVALLSQFGAGFMGIAQPVLGATIVFVGLYFLQRRGAYDDFIGVAMVIAGLAVFGISLVQYMTHQLVVFILGGSLGFGGLFLLTAERGLARLIGLVLLLAALAVLGINLLGAFRWW